MKMKIGMVGLILIAILLTGCFGGRSTKIEQVLLVADFETRESSVFLVLDASLTESVGFSSVDYSWLIDGQHGFSGKIIEIPLPHAHDETLILLTVVGKIKNQEVIDTKEFLYTLPEAPDPTDPDPVDPDPDPTDPDPVDPDPVSFTWERIGIKNFQFIGPIPENAKFWEWKFPNQNYWEGYIGIQKATHQFVAGGEHCIELKIFDQNGGLISHHQETIFVW